VEEGRAGAASRRVALRRVEERRAACGIRRDGFADAGARRAGFTRTGSGF